LQVSDSIARMRAGDKEQSSFISEVDENNLRYMSHVCFAFKHNSEARSSLYTYYSLNSSSVIKSHRVENHHLAGASKIVQLNASELRDTLWVPGSTLLSECIWAGPNQAHFLFGLHSYFEWSLSKPPNLPTFNRVFFAFCSPPKFNKVRWPWGTTVTDAFFQRMLKQRIITDRHQPYMEFSDKGPRYTCFEELYVYEDWGVLLSSEAVAREFRKAVVSPAVLYHHKAKQRNNRRILRMILQPESYLRAKSKLQSRLPSKPDSKSPPKPPPGSLKERCSNGSLHIAYFKRTAGDKRAAHNVDAIYQSVRAFTSHPLFTISTDRMLTMDRQFLEFNSFDILISPVGSHLANMVLINHTRVGIIELGLAIRDDFWRINALQRLNLTSYTYSHGHTVDPTCPERHLARNCTKVQKTLGNGIVCDDNYYQRDMNKDWFMPISWRLTKCSFVVNGTLLRGQIEQTVRTLCAVA